jgi:hypothetical protein
LARRDLPLRLLEPAHSDTGAGLPALWWQRYSQAERNIVETDTEARHRSCST